MSLWKSPLLIVGIVLILLTGAAGIAPLFIDWNRYKADLEEAGARLSGRKVTIGGDVSVRLFPWPVLKVRDIRIANPPGATLDDFARIAALEAEMEVAPLLSGDVVLRTARIVEPVVALERLADGRGTWQFAPTTAGRGPVAAEDIAVGGIAVEGGTVFLGDARRGGTAEIGGIDLTLSAPALTGPWKATGTALDGEATLAVTVSTGRWRPGQPLKFSAHLAPGAGAGFAYAFDGETLREDGRIAGRLTLQPAAAPHGKSDALGSGPALSVAARVTADFDEIAFDDIEIVPAGVAAAGNLMAGSARIALGDEVRLSARLAAPRIDVGEMTAGRTIDMSGPGPALEALSALAASLPQATAAEIELKVTTLISGGEALANVRVWGEAGPEGIRIRDLSGDLPGQTRAAFSGLLVGDAGGRGPQLSGEIALQSGSTRDLVGWALPEWRERLARTWAGARGRLGATARLDLSATRLRVSDGEVKLDDAAGQVSLVADWGEPRSVDLRLTADHLNLDRYLSAPEGGLPAPALAGAIEAVATVMGWGDAHLTVQADRLTWRGVAAEDIAIDAGASGDAIEVRTVEIGNVGGARLDVAGLVRFPDAGVAGSLSAAVKADDPRPLLRLVGVLDPQGGDAGWAASLGPADVKLIVDASEAEGVSEATLRLDGRAGTAAMTVSGRFSGRPSEWRDGTVALDGEVRADSARGLLAFAGLEPVAGGEGSAALAFAAAGVPRAGLSTTAVLDGLDARLQFAGTATADEGAPRLAGEVSMVAEQAGPLFAALGLDVATGGPAARLANLSASLAYDGASLKLSDLSAAAGGNAVSGEVSLARSDGRVAATADLEVGRVDVGWLAAALAYPAGTGTPGAETPFGRSWLAGALGSARLAADRLTLVPGVTLAPATARLAPAGSGGVAIDIDGTGADGQPATARLELAPQGAELAAAVRYDGPLDVAGFTRAEDAGAGVTGPARLALSLTGSGRSLGGLVAAATGTGTVTAPRLTVHGVAPEAFSAALSEVATAADVDRLVSGVLRSGAVELDRVAAGVAVEVGIATVEPVPIRAGTAVGEIKALVELASARADVSVRLRPGGVEGLPPFEMALAGPFGGLARSYDVDQLKSFVGVQVLQRGMDRLEELQREEDRLIEEERQFKLEQERRREADEAAARQAEERERARAEAEELMRKALDEEVRRALDDPPQPTVPAPRVRPAPPPPPAAPAPQPQPAPDDMPTGSGPIELPQAMSPVRPNRLSPGRLPGSDR